MRWLGIAAALAFLAMGCEAYLYPRFEKGMWSSYVKLQDVQLGMSQQEVEAIMGAPAQKEEGDYRGGRFTVYYYLTHTMDSEGSETVRGGYTPMVFQDDRLVGIGKRAYRGAVDRPMAEEPPRGDLPWTRTR